MMRVVEMEEDVKWGKKTGAEYTYVWFVDLRI